MEDSEPPIINPGTDPKAISNAEADSAATIRLEATVPAELAGQRLDQIAAQLFPDYSRSRLQAWIRAGDLLINGQSRRPRDRLQAGDALVVDTRVEPEGTWQAQPLPLNIVFEDAHLLIINKSSDSVVHPAAGHRDGTLLNGLLHHCAELKNLPRAGIVHRLDKDTTGLMVVAKTLPCHTALVRQMQAREISREYEAIVQGLPTGGGTVDAPLGRHPVQRKKRAVVREGQEAVTHYRLRGRFRAHAQLWVRLETGRTHQIRVHLAHIHLPIVGDPAYGGRPRIPAGCSAALREALQRFPRQALHAARLALQHPITGEALEFSAPRPQDMTELLKVLRADAGIEAGAEEAAEADASKPARGDV